MRQLCQLDQSNIIPRNISSGSIFYVGFEKIKRRIKAKSVLSRQFNGLGAWCGPIAEPFVGTFGEFSASYPVFPKALFARPVVMAKWK